MPRPRAPGCVAAKTTRGSRLGVGHPDLATREPRADPVGGGNRLLVRGVGPGVRFGQREHAERVAGGERAQPPPTLRVGAEAQEYFRDERVAHAQDDGDGRTGACDGLDRHRVRHVIVPQTAMLARDGDPEQPARSRLPDQ